MSFGVEDFYLPQESKYCIRLLNSKPKLFHPNRIHRVGNHSFCCSRDLVDGRWVGTCLFCKYYNDFHENGVPRCYPKGGDFQHDLRSIKPMERYYYNVLIRGAEALGPKIWRCGKVLHGTIISSIVGDQDKGKDGLGDITHPFSGRDFMVTVEKKEVGRIMFPFPTGKFQLPSPLGTDAQIEQWMAARHDLTQLTVKSNDKDMLYALEEIFGYLGASRKSKRVYRSIKEPFDPVW